MDKCQRSYSKGQNRNVSKQITQPGTQGATWKSSNLNATKWHQVGVTIRAPLGPNTLASVPQANVESDRGV